MKLRTLTAALGAGVLVFTANTAFAIDAPASVPAQVPAPAGSTLVTVLGTGITLSIVTDAAGHLTTVDLTDPTGMPPAGAVATEVSPHEVKFVIGAGATQVEVEAEGRSVKTEVETSALADLLGRHTWSGELFGVNGEATEIVFTIGDAGGAPTIVVDAVNGPGAGSEIVTQSSGDDDESEAKLRIELNDGSGHEARVTIRVEVEHDDDHAGAELMISARSDVFAVEEAVGPVPDPAVNVPASEQARDDDHGDHDSDHVEGEDHEGDDDRDEDHVEDRDEDHVEDEDHDEDHDEDEDRHDERGDHDSHERGDDHDDDD